MEKHAIINEIVKIIKQHLPHGTHKIVLFGSWAKGTAVDTSDIDIGILGDHEIPFDRMNAIKHAVDEIPTLRSIDIVDLNAVSETFKQNALKQARVL